MRWNCEPVRAADDGACRGRGDSPKRTAPVLVMSMSVHCAKFHRDGLSRAIKPHNSKGGWPAAGAKVLSSVCGDRGAAGHVLQHHAAFARLPGDAAEVGGPWPADVTLVRLALGHFEPLQIVKQILLVPLRFRPDGRSRAIWALTSQSNGYSLCFKTSCEKCGPTQYGELS